MPGAVNTNTLSDKCAIIRHAIRARRALHRREGYFVTARETLKQVRNEQQEEQQDENEAENEGEEEDKEDEEYPEWYYFGTYRKGQAYSRGHQPTRIL